MLFGMLHGVTAGLDDVIEQMSATRLRVMNRVNSIDSLPMAYKSQIEALPNVEKVAFYQTFVGYYQDQTNNIGVGAIGVEDFLEIYPEVDPAGGAARGDAQDAYGRDHRSAAGRGIRLEDRRPRAHEVPSVREAGR